MTHCFFRKFWISFIDFCIALVISFRLNYSNRSICDNWLSRLRLGLPILIFCNADLLKARNYMFWKFGIGHSITNRLCIGSCAWLAQGSRLMAHASRLVFQGSWFMAKKKLALGLGAWGTRRQIFLGHAPRDTSLEAWAMSLEAWTMHHSQ